MEKIGVKNVLQFNPQLFLTPRRNIATNDGRSPGLFFTP